MDHPAKHYGSGGEKQQFTHYGKSKGCITHHQETHARQQPQYAQPAQRPALNRVASGPVTSRREQKAHGNRRHKGPQHLVRVPQHAAQTPRKALWRENPQRDRHRSPQTTGHVQGPETKLQ